MSLSVTRERRANAGNRYQNQREDIEMEVGDEYGDTFKELSDDEEFMESKEKREEKEKKKKARRALILPPLSINLRKRKTDQLSNEDICNNSVKHFSSQKKDLIQSKRRNPKSINNNNLEDDKQQLVPILPGVRSSSRSYTLQSKQLLAEKLKEYEEKKLLYPKREKIVSEILTQEELLAEAKETEARNLASLKEFELRENKIKNTVRRSNRIICPITGLPAKYKDPRSGIPYANMEAYFKIQELINHQYTWYGKGCVYLNDPDQSPAKGVPDKFGK
ncbi:6650_t:CDS:2 [Entrophospora sp. SA101]|nr:6650_t:CDS:2 [Entrophospora sp. SA101]